MQEKLPDYSEFLKQEGMFEHIEKEWIEKSKHIHQMQADAVNSVIVDYSTVIEIGCGTGNIASLVKSRDQLDHDHYIGIDKNPQCIGLAAYKNKGKKFICGDIRELELLPAAIVCAFGIMKHFGLHEWDEVLAKLVYLSSKYVIIDIPITKEASFDDGNLHGHHHVWMNEKDFKKRVNKEDMIIVNRIDERPIEPIFICKKK